MGLDQLADLGSLAVESVLSANHKEQYLDKDESSFVTRKLTEAGCDMGSQVKGSP